MSCAQAVAAFESGTVGNIATSATSSGKLSELNLRFDSHVFTQVMEQ